MSAVIAVVRTEGIVPQEHLRLMSDHRSKRIENTRTQSIAQQLTGAELAFRFAAEYMGISAEYSYLPDGRPQPAEEGYYMSLTHTDGLAACVIARVPVGIDAEGERKILPSLSKKILAPGEQGDLREIWVKKESYLKRTGEGIRRPMTDFSAEEIDGYLHAFCVDKYYISVCAEEKVDVKIFQL